MKCNFHFQLCAVHHVQMMENAFLLDSAAVQQSGKGPDVNSVRAIIFCIYVYTNNNNMFCILELLLSV